MYKLYTIGYSVLFRFYIFLVYIAGLLSAKQMTSVFNIPTRTRMCTHAPIKQVRPFEEKERIGP